MCVFACVCVRECWGRRVGDLCSDCSKQRPALKAMGCCCIPCCVATTIFSLLPIPVGCESCFDD